MWVSVSKIDYDQLSLKSNSNENSSQIKERVTKARKLQAERFNNHQIFNKKLNSEMSVSDIEKCLNLKGEVVELLKSSCERLDLSARAYHRIIKLAQTIADLDGVENIETNHILEAMQYRQKTFN
jgi:magnesium chelatase family protein